MGLIPNEIAKDLAPDFTLLDLSPLSQYHTYHLRTLHELVTGIEVVNSFNSSEKGAFN